jgi:hypothetical protein
MADEPRPGRQVPGCELTLGSVSNTPFAIYLRTPKVICEDKDVVDVALVAASEWRALP